MELYTESLVSLVSVVPLYQLKIIAIYNKNCKIAILNMQGAAPYISTQSASHRLQWGITNPGIIYVCKCAMMQLGNIFDKNV